MTSSYTVRRSDPGVATGYEDESKRASSSSSRRAKRKSPAYKPSSSSSPISSRPSPEGEERGLESHLSSTSASFADSTARRRRPISIASSEGAGSGGKSLRLARAPTTTRAGARAWGGASPLRPPSCSRARTTAQVSSSPRARAQPARQGRCRPSMRAVPNPRANAPARVPTSSQGRHHQRAPRDEALQPAQEDLRCTRIRDRLLAQTTFDLCVNGASDLRRVARPPASSDQHAAGEKRAARGRG